MSETLHPGIKLPWIYVFKDDNDFWVWVEGLGKVLCYEPERRPLGADHVGLTCFKAWRPAREQVCYIYPREEFIEAVRAAVERHGK
jgi:hypothetical protein